MVQLLNGYKTGEARQQLYKYEGGGGTLLHKDIDGNVPSCAVLGCPQCESAIPLESCWDDFGSVTKSDTIRASWRQTGSLRVPKHLKMKDMLSTAQSSSAKPPLLLSASSEPQFS